MTWTTKKAAKEHQCNACCGRIEKGEHYFINSLTMTPNPTSAKEKLFALYLGQKVHKPTGLKISELTVANLLKIQDYLQLRAISDLTGEEKDVIATYMQWHPDDVIEWINGDCSHHDFEDMYTWFPLYDILRGFGIALPFTVLEDGKPRTYSVEEQWKLNWITINNLKN